MTAREPWHAEELFDEARAADLIAARFGAPTSIHRLGEGWDSVAFLVDGDRIFRFPKRASVVPRLRQELAVLPLLQELPLAVPQPTWIGEPGPDTPLPFVGYPMLPGVPADTLEAIEPGPVIAGCLAFLDALHALPDEGVLGEVEGWPDEEPAPPEHPVAERALDWLAGSSPPRVPPVLIHDDLGLCHVLVDPRAGVPVGVIDWGDLSRGDPAHDLVGLYLRWPDALAPAIADREGLLQRVQHHAIRASLADCEVIAEWEPQRAEAAWSTLQRRLDRLA